MRKSMKKIAATAFTAAMTMGLAVTAFGAEINPTAIPTGETVFTVTGNMTTPSWALNDDANAMKATEFDGIVSFDLTMPAYDEANKWMSRFSIGAFNSDTLVAGWNRILLGVPTIPVGDLGNGLAGDLTNLTQIRVATPEETAVTVYFDTTTYGLAILDAEGNQVDYQIGWCTGDDEETYYTPEEFAELTWDTYSAQLVNADRAGNLATVGVSELPNFVELRDAVIAKMNPQEEEKESGEIDPTQIPDGETIFTVTGNMTNPAWALNDKANKMEELDNGLMAFYATMPAYDEANKWASRFSIGAFNKDSLVAGWNRILLGAPSINVGDLGNGLLGDLTNLTQVRVATPEATDVVILFDPKTYGLAVLDLDGNSVEYQIGWVTADDEETYYTPEEFAAMTWDDYVAQIVNADRKTSLDTLGVAELPDFATLRDNVIAKFNGEDTEEPSEDEEEPSEDEEEPSEDETDAPELNPDENDPAYSVVGSQELGIDWVPDADFCFVQDNGDGTYSKTLIATADGDFEFKILEDGPTFAWANQLQLGTGLFTDNASQFKLVGVTAGDVYVVTFDPETGDVWVEMDGEEVEFLVRWATREEDPAEFLTKEEAIAQFVDVEDEEEPSEDEEEPSEDEEEPSEDEEEPSEDEEEPSEDEEEPSEDEEEPSEDEEEPSDDNDDDAEVPTTNASQDNNADSDADADNNGGADADNNGGADADNNNNAGEGATGENQAPPTGNAVPVAVVFALVAAAGVAFVAKKKVA